MRELLRNPELVRHVRAEMRAPRMLLSAGLAVLISFLVSLVHTQATSSSTLDQHDIARSLFLWLAVLHFIVLPLWAFSASIQSIAGERLLKTYDFVRTTRLTSAELLFGYLFGAPLMAYFTVGISAVFAILSGLGVGMPLGAMLATYILLFVFTVFVSLFGLLVSMLIERPRAAGSLFVLWFLAWPASALGMAATASPFPGTASLALVPGLARLFNPESKAPLTAPFFGLQLPMVVLSVVLYVSFGAWIVLAIIRNLKKEREEIQLLTRTQALMLIAFMNLLFLGLFDRSFHWPYQNARNPFTVTTVFIFMNQALLYIVGAATLTPAERLKVWYRDFKGSAASYLAETGLPWPWMVIAGGIAFIGVALIGVISQSADNHFDPGWSALAVALVLTFAVRDILFLQWCLLTRMKSPIGKGIGLIWLYYFAATVVSSVFVPYANRGPNSGLFFLTPVGVFAGEGKLESVIAELIFQICLAGVILYLINQRLTQMQANTVASAAAA
jgi:hypothetical protein